MANIQPVPVTESDLPEPSGELFRWLPPTVSVLVHTVLILLLALVTYDDAKPLVARILVVPPPEKEDDPPVEVELQPEIDVVLDNVALVNAAPAPAAAASASSMPTLDTSLLAKADRTAIPISAPSIGIPDAVALIESVPDGEVKGEARDIVDSYQQALDRLAQELLWMLDRGPVLAVWCFDQSNSMKDDQQEIRDRFETVYEQLGLTDKVKNDALLTAVTSYGGGFVDHTQHKPTSNRDLIREAIDSIPVDASGKEMMCSAVGTTISTYRDLARRGRQMALILVTDESGERENNDAYLEQAIAIAKATKCRIYVLGRESVFGYPYAFFRWQHPETNRIHWLPMDRGPETAFPEQLQTNGFRRRHDAFSSGFGPYEQARMARETNGIFFMLPSIEEDVVGRYKESYATEALRPYRPDLRARIEVLADRDEFPLRTLIWKVIQDLNPYEPSNRKALEMRMGFSINPQEFVTQARREQEKAKLHLRYMAEAEKALIDGSLLREQEADPRWQANYDIILAQLIAYQARIYEYGVALDAFIAKPKTAEPMRGNRRHVNWDIRTVKRTLTEDAQPYIDRATSMFEQIKVDHPGSPWAARARWELQRGYGVDLYPEYRTPIRSVSNPMPVPKL
ncbi:MAG: vWA domain-containing protein [Planctomycetota bacterium]